MPKREAEVKHRAPYGVPIMPSDNLQIDKRIKSIESLIKKKAKQLLKQGVDTDACQKYLNSIVEEHIARLKSEIERNHLFNIGRFNSIFRRRASDKAEIKGLLETIDAEINATKDEFDFVEALYYKYNPLYKGKGTINNNPYETVETEYGDE